MQIAKVENSHTYGVLDPQMRERRDTKFLQGALDDAVNVITLPQGGYVDRGGTTDFGKIRHKLSDPAAVPVISYPNGGTVVGGLRQTDPIPVFPVLFASVTFAAAVDIVSLDLIDASLAPTLATASPETGLISCEVRVGVTWQPFGSSALISNQQFRSVSFAVPPDGAPLAITGYRFTVSGVVQQSRVRWRSQSHKASSAVLSKARSITFNRTKAERYILIFTDGHCDVFMKGIWHAGFPFPATEAMVRALKFTSRYDTIVVTHEDMFPQMIQRFGATDWSTRDCPFVNIPLYDYGGNYMNGVTEKQTVTIYGLNDGQPFDLAISGFVSEQITTGVDGPGTAIAIKAALERVQGVRSGLTVTYQSGTHGTKEVYEVEFTGAGNANRAWPKMDGSTPEAGAYVSVMRKLKGQEGGEPVFSVARGYPSVAKFSQERLVYAGLKSFGNGLGASKTGSPFDLDINSGGATAGFLYEVEMTEVAPIRDIYGEQGLVLFTDSAVHSMANAVLSADETPDFRTALAPGIKGDCPILRSDTSIFYVQHGGQALQTLGYTDNIKNYIGTSASVLSAFLVDNPIGAARRGATKEISADLMFYVNEAGALITVTSMMSQDVSGFCPHATEGLFHDVVVDGDDDVWLIADRVEGGATERRLERMEPTGMLDAALEYVLGAPTTILGGLARFNGRSVWAIVDDLSVQGPFAVADGQLTLEVPAEAHVRVGLWTPPMAKDLPVDLHSETGRPMPLQKRVNQVLVSCLRTSSLAIGANEGTPVNIDLQFFGSAVFGGTQLEFPFSGVLNLEGFPGFTPDAQVVVTQSFPGKLNVRGLTKNLVA